VIHSSCEIKQLSKTLGSTPEYAKLVQLLDVSLESAKVILLEVLIHLYLTNIKDRLS
jgi:hypothetical protein